MIESFSCRAGSAICDHEVLTQIAETLINAGAGLGK